MEPLTKVVTTRVKVDDRIADLVYFVKYIRDQYAEKYLLMSDDELIALADNFWDRRHGED